MTKLQFKRKADFGQFCMMLREGRVSFSLAGFLIIILVDMRSIEELPEGIKKLFEKLRVEGRAGLYPLKGARRPPPPRRLLTSEEAGQILKKSSKRWSKKNNR